MQYIVQVIPLASSQPVCKEIDIPACQNRVGELVVKTSASIHRDGPAWYSISVHVTTLPPDMQSKIKESELWLNARSDMPGVLAGQVTPKGKRNKQPGGIKVEGRPEYQELYDALLAANQLIYATEEQLKEASKPAPVIIPDGMVKVTCIGSKADGWISVYRDEQGNEFDAPQIAGSERGTEWMTPEAHAAALGQLQAAAQAAADKETRRLERIVEEAESLQSVGKLLTVSGQASKAREYDNAYNEGGDGYNPYRGIVSLEEYNAAKTALAARVRQD